MIFFGVPNLLKTWSLKRCATPCEVTLVVVSTAITILVSLSTVTKMALYPLDFGRGLMRPTVMTSHGASGALWGCKGQASGLFWYLFRWHTSQAAAYLAA